MTLIRDPWYGIRGFRPYLAIDNKIDETGLKFYEKNKQITQTMLIKNINLSRIINECNKKYKSNYSITLDGDKDSIGDKSLSAFGGEGITKINDIASHVTLVSDFVKILMKDFDKYCQFIEYFTTELFSGNYGLFDFFNKSFYLLI